MASTITNIYMDDDAITLLVCRGERIKTWGKVKLDPETIQGMTILDAEKLASNISGLWKQLGVKSRKFNVGISAQQCLTRYFQLPALPKNLLVEAIEREARRLLPLPPEELYLSWQITAAPENKQDVFLVALLRKNVDQLLSVFKSINLQVNSLSLKPLALARLLKEPNSLLVDAQATEFDIVLMVRGIPNPMRTIPFIVPDLSWEDKTSIILEEVDRTLKFYRSNNPELPLPDTMPLYCTGDLVGQDAVCQAIADRFSYPFTLLTLTTDHPAGFHPQSFAINIALATQNITMWQKSAPGLILNILPEEFRIKPVRWTRVLPVPAGLAVVGVMVPMLMMIVSATTNINAARAEFTSTNQILLEKQTEKLEIKKEIVAIQEELDRINTETGQVTELLSGLAVAAETRTADLQMIIDNIKPDMSLSMISMAVDDVTVNGYGKTEAIILDYARVLDDIQRYSRTTMDSISLQQDGTYSFSLVLTR